MKHLILAVATLAMLTASGCGVYDMPMPTASVAQPMPTASVAQQPNEWDKARAELQKLESQLAAKSKEIDAMPNGADKSERARQWLVEYDAFEKARKEYNAELAQYREQWLR